MRNRILFGYKNLPLLFSPSSHRCLFKET